MLCLCDKTSKNGSYRSIQLSLFTSTCMRHKTTPKRWKPQACFTLYDHLHLCAASVLSGITASVASTNPHSLIWLQFWDSDWCLKSAFTSFVVLVVFLAKQSRLQTHRLIHLLSLKELCFWSPPTPPGCVWLIRLQVLHYTDQLLPSALSRQQLLDL